MAGIDDAVEAARLDHLFTQGPKACSEGPGGNCDWKLAYVALYKEFTKFKLKVIEESDKEVDRYDGMVESIKTKVDVLLKNLDTENRKLAKLNDGLKMKAGKLEGQLAETKSAMNNQLSHASDLKKELERSFRSLEDELRCKETNLRTLRINLEESKALVDRLTKEVRNQDIEIEGLRKVAVELKQQCDEDVKHLVEKNDTIEADLQYHYHDALDLANANFLELERKLIDREIDLCKLLDDEKARSAELRRNGSFVQQSIQSTLREALEAIVKVKMMSIAKNKVLQSDMKKVAHALKVMRDEVACFHLESEKVRHKVYQILEVDKRSAKVIPEVLPATATRESYDLLKSISTGVGMPASELGCNMLAIIEKERRNIAKFVLSLTNWSVTLGSERERYDEQILHLEGRVSSEKMKHIREMEFAARKLAIYKKLIFKLRKKLDEREVKSRSNAKDENKKNGDEALPNSELPIIPTRTTEKAGANSLDVSAERSQVACCAEFKYLLEQSEKMIQRIEESDMASKNAFHR